MHNSNRLLILSATAVLLLLGACAKQPPVAAPAPAPNGRAPDTPKPDPQAPDSFTVSVQTTRGPVLLAIYRAWAPVGVDRFYRLVRERYYDSAAVYRVVPKFVVQFGLAADPKRTATWRRQSLQDDSVRTSNLRGTVTFARGGPNSRTTQLFINLVDNARLDTSNGFGFPPIGRVVQGMELVDQFNAEYSATTPSQDSISRQGNSYLVRAYPRLDYILGTKIVREWKRR